jgi:hypothetical protein
MILAIIFASSSVVYASDLQIGGRVVDKDGKPAEGPIDIEARFFDESTKGEQVGPTITMTAVVLVDGVFNAPLKLNEAEKSAVFGTGKPIYLQLTDLTNKKTFTRQQFGAVPFAMRIPIDSKTLSFDDNGQLTVGSGSKSAGDVLSVDGAGNLTWASKVLPTTGGAMSGPLSMANNSVTNLANPINPQDAATKNYVDSNALKSDGSTPLTANWPIGGFDITGLGNMDIQDDKRLGLGKVNTGDEASFTAGWDDTQEGYMWFDPDTNEIKYWDGSAVKTSGAAGAGLGNFNGQTGTTQTLSVPGTTGNAPNWASAGDAHTLHIPMANAGAGVTAGLISNADHVAFSAKAADADVLKKDGSVALTGNWDVGANKITNLGAPTVGGDATTKTYVDNLNSTLDAAVLKKDGSVALTGNWDVGANKITNLGAPTVGGDATTKTYVDGLVSGLAADSAVVKKDGSVALTADWDVGANKITNLAAPTVGADAVTKTYADGLVTGLAVDSTVLKKDGSVSLTADWDIGAVKISNVAEPTLSGDVATKNYVDTQTPSGAWSITGSDLEVTNATNEVGIGVTPLGKFHVKENEPEMIFHDDGPGGSAQLSIFRNDTSIATSNQLGYLSFSGSDTTANARIAHATIRAFAPADHSSGNNPSELVITTTPVGSDVPLDRMTIKADGSIGIGTSAPAQELSVLGEILASKDEDAGDSTNSAAVMAGNSGVDQGVVKVQFTNGAANANPSGGISFEPRNNADSAVFSGGIAGFEKVSGEDSSFFTVSTTNGTVVGERLRVDKDGYVGIGTTNPLEMLHIVTGASSAEVRLDAGSNQDTGIRFKGDRSWLIQNDGDASLGASDYLHIWDAGSGSSSMVFDTSGNVGIGTINPGARLHVKSASAEVMTLDDNSNTVSLSLSGDRIFHDTDADGVKDGGEEFIDQAGGALGCTIVTAAIPNGNPTNATASCAATYTLTGGGCSGVNGSGGCFSWPLNDTDWYCLNKESSNGRQCYARCCRIE